MRPEISGRLEQRVENLHEQAGYATPSELVRDAVRRRMDELERELKVSEQPKYELFQYEIRSNQVEETIKLDLSPKPNSGLRLKYVDKGPTPHHVELRTGSETLREHAIQEALKPIDGVVDAGFITKPRIRVKIQKDTTRPFSVIVEEVFDTLYEVVGMGGLEEVEETRQEELQKAVDRYASPR
jgi:hypothetical protein